jgi:hypothetical protein
MFIDYTQAFDSIKRNKVLECLIQQNIPAKLQKLIALTLTGTNAIVKINNEFTDKFDVQTGGQTRRPTISYPLQHCNRLNIKENGTERKHLYQTKAMHRLCR